MSRKTCARVMRSLGVLVTVGVVASSVGSNAALQTDGPSYVFASTPIGLTDGQTFRACQVNSLDRPGSAMQWVASLRDSATVVIARTEVVEIPSKQFRCMDFNRDELPVSGEASGRIQFVVESVFRVGGVIPGSTLELPLSMEILDNSAARTSLYLVSTSSQYQVQR